jgi:hypothetical protein
VILVLGAIQVVWELGVAHGKAQANHDLWANPPGMASCVTYPDGGKRCTPEFVPAPVSKVECVRRCATRDRMERVTGK